MSINSMQKITLNCFIEKIQCCEHYTYMVTLFKFSMFKIDMFTSLVLNKNHYYQEDLKDRQTNNLTFFNLFNFCC